MPTEYVCVLYGYQNKQRLLPFMVLLIGVCDRDSVYCAVLTGSLTKTEYVPSLKG